MKTKIITIIAAAVLVFVYITNSAKAVITDVEITPEEPTMEDIITIVTFGIEGIGPVEVTDSVFNITDKEIVLDISLDVGFLQVLTPWSHSEDIGTLPVGTYDLTVRTIVYSDVIDSYFTTFQVVPEPGTALLLCFGMACVRQIKRKKSHQP